MLTDIFPSFVVTVRANPSLDTRNGEILWGISILKRKHFVLFNSVHFPAISIAPLTPTQAGFLTFLPFLLSPPLLCAQVSYPNLKRQITGKVDPSSFLGDIQRPSEWQYHLFPKDRCSWGANTADEKGERAPLPVAGNGWSTVRRACSLSLQYLKQTERNR